MGTLDTELRWNRGPANSRLTRYCLYVSILPVLGLLLSGLVLFLTLLPELLSNPEALVLVLLLAVVGGPVSLLYLWPVLTDPEQRSGVVDDSWLGALDPLGVAVTALVGLVAVVGSFRLADYGIVVLVGVCMGVGLPVAGLLATRGRIDPETLTLYVERDRNYTGGLAVEMRNWTALRRHRLGSVTVCIPSYAPGTDGSAPRLFVLPTSVATEADGVFQRALAASTDAPTRPGNPAVAVTLAAFGVGTLALGAGLWWLVDLPTGIALWILAFCVTFGLLFLLLAKRER
ncbi:hypothetical protein NDI56_15795 [Haloarcula sp. S1CR25-12]|uniref:PH domain-containing protein n=1 Tax=Haloarcula saliterrae TaxID=2950534 RepID=A0ABU2FFY7_9EURY|nr:hypothetical protein [Haloarcula sp. S1CR25-12]MDS0260868.1 hypothetical protein [Haloarcula sp. S1CR25-12]